MTPVPMATIAVGLAPIIPMANLVVVQQEIVEPTDFALAILTGSCE